MLNRVAVVLLLAVSCRTGTIERKPETEAPVSSHPCDLYMKCCIDYLDALYKVTEHSESALQQAKEACWQIGALRDTPEVTRACSTAFEAMNEAIAQNPENAQGFQFPDSCKTPPPN